jgi:bacterioferritin-associated ferredoxin
MVIRFEFFSYPASQNTIVRILQRTSDRQITRHARAGMGFDEIQFELGVATQCGKCESCARDVLAQCIASCPKANIHSTQPAANLQGTGTWQTSLSPSL